MPITRAWQRDLDRRLNGPFTIGQKVRRIDEPKVVLHVRELDLDGQIDGTAKALCTNSFGHGRWMALTDLEAIS